jgi:hypothetical protein
MASSLGRNGPPQQTLRPGREHRENSSDPCSTFEPKE